MNKKDFHEMTDDELLVEKKEMKISNFFSAAAIGFLAGIIATGIVAWSFSPKKQIGFLIPILIPIIFIYKQFKKPDKYKDLKEILKKRGLN
jgi:hypothetical protein